MLEPDPESGPNTVSPSRTALGSLQFMRHLSLCLSSPLCHDLPSGPAYGASGEWVQLSPRNLKTLGAQSWPLHSSHPCPQTLKVSPCPGSPGGQAAIRPSLPQAHGQGQSQSRRVVAQPVGPSRPLICLCAWVSPGWLWASGDPLEDPEGASPEGLFCPDGMWPDANSSASITPLWRLVLSSLGLFCTHSCP